MMSNIVDDFSFTIWYNSIMKDRAESHRREKSRGGFCRGEEMPHATQTQATVFPPRLPESL